MIPYSFLLQFEMSIMFFIAFEMSLHSCIFVICFCGTHSAHVDFLCDEAISRNGLVPPNSGENTALPA